MNLAVEDDGFEVEVDGALAGFLSFEHEPSTEAQKAEVREMAAKFAKAEELFKAPEAAGCKAQSVALSSGNLPAELLAPYAAPPEGEGGHGHEHGDHGHGDHGHGEEAGHDHDDGDHAHADLEIAVEFKCSNVSALSGLSVGLFEAFPSLEDLDVQIVSPKGQASAELGRSNTELKW
jgi:hypothetical protein